MKEENKKLILKKSMDSSASGGHASDEEIIAYQFGMIDSQKENERLQDHFADCRQCTQALLELNELTEIAAAQNPPPGEEMWQQFKGKLNAEPFPVGNIISEKIDQPKRFSFFDYFSLNFVAAAGASLALLIIVGLIITAVRNSGSNELMVAQNERVTNENSMPFSVNTRTDDSNTLPTEQRTEISNNRPVNRNTNSIPNSKTRETPANSTATPKTVNSSVKPSTNPVSAELYPDESVRSIDSPDLRKVKVSRNAKEILLKLAAPPSKFPGRFTVEITDAQKSLVLTRVLKASKTGSFQLMVSSSQISPGVYLLNLYEQTKSGRKLFKSYSFVVEFE